MYGKASSSIKWFDKWAEFKATKIECYWGARAIFHGGDKFELVHDRMQCEGGSAHDRKELAEWINKKGLNHLRTLLKRNHLTTNSHDDVRLEIDGYYLYATPNASCGYLYVSTWELPL